MRKNYIEIPKKVYYPDMDSYKNISFARTQKQLKKEEYECFELPEWLKDCIEEYAEQRAGMKLAEFKKQIKSLFT